MYKCKFCGKQYDMCVQLGGHITRCKDNPDLNINLMKIKRKFKKRIVIKKECKKCGKEFEQTIIEDGKNYIKKFCSRKCANSRIFDIETKNKISIGVKTSKNIKNLLKIVKLKKCASGVVTNF